MRVVLKGLLNNKTYLDQAVNPVYQKYIQRQATEEKKHKFSNLYIVDRCQSNQAKITYQQYLQTLQRSEAKKGTGELANVINGTL